MLELRGLVVDRRRAVGVSDPATDPATEAEWEEAVAAAVWLIAVDAAEQYGLITGPTVNVERCEEIIEAGRERGMTIPTLDEVIAR